MQGKPTISIVLDERRALASGAFPVKLRITFRVVLSGKKSSWVRRYYGLGEASPALFAAAIKVPRSSEQKDLAASISKARKKAEEILDAHQVMSPVLFDRLFTGNSGSTVLSRFDAYIAELRKYGRVGTASSYNTAKRSFREFAGGDVSFQEITLDWLRRYDRWMKSHKMKKVVKGETVEVVVSSSVSTVAIYLRCLRKIYNDAVADKLISADFYPFGRRQFVIQSAQAPKHALTEDQKNAVLSYQGPNRKAADFWIFSYFCNGMAFADICRLRNRDIQEDTIFMERVKTASTTRMLKKIEIPMREEVKEIIRKYSVKSLDPDAFVFGVLQAGLSPQQQKNRILDFIDKTNTGLRKVAMELGFTFKFTTYTARHTFATISVQKGASKAFIQEAMGHSSMRTTENYLAGFDRETKRKMNAKL